MAENTPNPPGGAMPPKPAEASKVQPKKETVRITLPPKPTAAPTVKLPSLAAQSTAPAAPAGPPAAAPAAAAPATSVGLSRAAGTSAPGLARGTPGPKTQIGMAPRPAPAAARSSGVDTVLAIAAGMFGLASVGVLLFLWWTADKALTTFAS